ncbi:hypothetical protein [Clostridium ganghwense]|uniref:SbsC C-terminal domain-containing protein n=1 Tax=Clostridium ganghwense TaxID=312089 RepID=A0ABT4CQG7_9CLOT|nr:hypothetical protein [Clostridium ganghwense]MCY6371163.1 hypothetical protein [Clostridium ganghwense]
MKSKKTLSMILSAVVLAGGIGLAPAKAMADTKDGVKVASTVNTKNVGEVVFKAINDLSEKNIKEARLAIANLQDSHTKHLYNKTLDYHIYSNIDKKVSPVDELMNAYDKTAKMRSAESKVNFDIKLNGQNLSKEEQQSLAPVMAMINSLKVNATSKYKSNEKNTKIFANSDINIDFMQQVFNLKAWMDINTEGKQPNMKYIVSIPEAMKNLTPELKGKDYIVYDTSKIYEKLNVPNMDYGKMMGVYEKYGKRFQEALLDFIRVADAKYSIVTRKGQGTILNGKEKVNLYQIKLDNDKLVKVVKLAMQDENMKKLIKDYLKDTINVAAEMQDKKISQQDLEKIQQEIDKQLEIGMTQLVAALEEMNKSVKFEIVLNCGVNKDGYIASEAGSFKVTVDSAKLQGKNNGSKYTCTINYNSELYNINGDVKVEAMPKVNEKNSIDYVDMLMNNVPSQNKKVSA